MPELEIRVSEEGVRNVRGHVGSASEGTELGLLSAELSLAISLLDRAAREFGHKPPVGSYAIAPQIFVPRSSDDQEPVFEQMDLRVAPAVRGIFAFNAAPDWFITAIKKNFSEEKHHVDLWQMCAPAETAVEIFLNAQTWAGSAGWSISSRPDDGIDVVLVVEPAVADAEFIESVIDFCKKTHLTFRVTGTSWSEPSTTFRIEIFPLVAE
jgi:hypothetical protein